MQLRLARKEPPLYDFMWSEVCVVFSEGLRDPCGHILLHEMQAEHGGIEGLRREEKQRDGEET